VVKTESGQTIEYGKTEDARQVLGGTVLAWYINRVTDRDGNYMTYHYGHEGNEIYLSSIDYTGNSNEPPSNGFVIMGGTGNPYAHVYFDYTTGGHYGSTFVAGHEIKQSRLLTGIRAYGWENTSVISEAGTQPALHRRYAFDYDHASEQPLLASITLFAGDGTRYNPTKIDWDQTDYGKYPYNQQYLSQNEGLTLSNTVGDNSELLEINEDVEYISADFNGDGYADVLKWEGRVFNKVGNTATRGLFHWDLFINQTNGRFTKNNRHVLPEGWEVIENKKTHDYSIQWCDGVLDLNSFGGEDEHYVVAKCILDIIDCVPFNDDKNRKASSLLVLEDSIVYTTNSIEYYCQARVYHDLGREPGIPYTEAMLLPPFKYTGDISIRTGDFTGDELDDICLLFYEEKELHLKGKYETASGQVRDISKTINLPSGAPQSIVVLDHDGNGLKDVMVTIGSTYYIYGFKDDDFKLIKTLPVGNLSPTPYTGDFNGDKISDLLWRDNSAQTIFVAFGTGTGYTSPKNTGRNLFYNTSPVIADINGDGLDDVLHFIPSNSVALAGSSNMLKMNAYCNMGYKNNNLFFTEALPIPLFSTSSVPYDDWNYGIFSYPIGDFNNDHQLDILTITKQLAPGRAIPLGKIRYFMGKAAEPLVRKITDGMGLETRIAYKPFYGWSNHCIGHPYAKVFFYLTDTLSLPALNGTYDNPTPYFHVTYTYTSPYISPKRDAFLGFETVNSNDDLREYGNMTRQYEKKNEMMLLAREVTSMSKYAGTPDRETTYTNEMVFSRFAGVFIPHVSKTITRNRVENQVREKRSYLNANTGKTDSTVTLLQGLQETRFLTREARKYAYLSLALPNGVTALLPREVIKEEHERDDGSPLTTRESYQYDSRGRVTQKIETYPDNMSLTTRYESYNRYGLPTVKSVAENNGPERRERYEYGSISRYLTKTINALGHETSATYDHLTGNVLTTTDINGLTTRYHHDSFGRRDTVTYPDGNQTITRVRWCGSTIDRTLAPRAVYAIRVKEPGQTGTETYYDRLDREVFWYDQDKLQMIDTRYTKFGQVEKRSLPFHNKYLMSDNAKLWTTYSYDNYRRLTSEISNLTNMSYSYYVPSSNSGTPGEIVITDNLRHTTAREKYDAAGRVSAVTDPGGNIQYNYSLAHGMTGLGRQQEIVCNGGAPVNIYTDYMGNRSLVIDPDLGRVGTTYNLQGDMTLESNNDLSFTRYQHDLLGRVTDKEIHGIGEPTIRIHYDYDDYSPAHRGRGQLSRVTQDGVLKEAYVYDELGRLQTKTTYTRYNNNESYTESYTYTNKSQIASKTFPDGFVLKYTYNADGTIRNIKDGTGKTLHEVISRDAAGHLTRALYGSITGDNSSYFEDRIYNQQGLLTEIKTSDGVYTNSTPNLDYDGSYTYTTDMPSAPAPPQNTVMLSYVKHNFRWLHYDYDNAGRMISRADSLFKQVEMYAYDNMDRLTDTRTLNKALDRVAHGQMIYHPDGNIAFTSGAGEYLYFGKQPHAVSFIDGLPGYENEPYNIKYCNTKWNSMNRIETIVDSIYRDPAHGAVYSFFWYNPHGQRDLCFVGIRDYPYNSFKMRCFIGDDYEIEESGTEAHDDYQHQYTRRHLHYVYGDDGLVGIHARQDGETQGEMFHVHTDHLGSYNLVLNEHKNEVDRLWFDPWGNRVNPGDWLQKETLDRANSHFFNRGFCGHEHLDYSNLINMNARLYDPTIARFLSPDPYVQLPNNTQSYNRYSYCMNSPLMYTDPSGEFAWMVPIMLGAFINTAVNIFTGNVHSQSDMWISAAIGGASGAAGALVEQWAWTASAIGGFGGDFTARFASGATAGFISGAGNAWLSGADFGYGLAAGVKGGLIGGAISGLIGGLIAGTNAKSADADFWTGKFSVNLTMGTSPESYTEALRKAAEYNANGYADNDDRLDFLMKTEMNFRTGDLTVKDLTTKVPDGLGLTSDEVYLDKDGGLIYGTVRGIYGKSYTMSISPKVVNAEDIVHFRAFAGHEIIHAYHYSAMPFSQYSSKYSERIALEYTHAVYSYAEQCPFAEQFFNYYSQYPALVPAIYNVPPGLPWRIYP
jgi:RHS repeat-associated protein